MTAILALALAASQPAWILTPDGLGPVKIGMTQAQVAKALGGTLTGDAIESDDICVEKDSSKLPGVGFMFEEKKLVRISLVPDSKIATLRGVRAGATAAKIRRAYPKGLLSEPNAYLERPAEYLTFWTVRGKKGVRFETDEKRQVYVIHAGTAAIQYIEGCA